MCHNSSGAGGEMDITCAGRRGVLFATAAADDDVDGDARTIGGAAAVVVSTTFGSDAKRTIR